MKKHFLIILLVSLPPVLFAETLKPFTSDGCSAFPDGTIAQNTLWLSCCRKHDFDYWKGGTYQERFASDKALKSCVAAVGESEVALLMLAGVRVGGSPFFPTTFRWGYGWPYPRFYGALSELEQKQIEAITAPSPPIRRPQ
ncbi:MAG: FAD-binding oxidoreductase [Agarilytica sp.]